MSNPLIPGGYILLSRKIIDSEIWDKPPLYMKVWIWLLEKAQHREFRQLKRGQLFTSIEDIQKGVSWHIGYRKEIPTKDQIYQIIDWMRKSYEGGNEAQTRAMMIATTKATHGLLVNIENYTVYQDPKNYESNDEGNNEKGTKATRKQRQPNNINKECKESEEVKKLRSKDIYSDLIQNYTLNIDLQNSLNDFIEFRKEIKKPMTEKAVILALKELNKLATDDETKIEVINQSILKNWTGLFALKEIKQAQPKTHSSLDMLMEMYEEAGNE